MISARYFKLYGYDTLISVKKEKIGMLLFLTSFLIKALREFHSVLKKVSQV
ncbi:hypothetical protein MTsPCn9_27140 [Croceitalea sp. MTPC9]|nr:hypothetical protein MTsPCn6_23040 [Croceitalea sp. MTPC6]GMN17776.1 hypothetical protein MTsPCn9_27140 [Croceitalea sp. MTPC9]